MSSSIVKPRLLIAGATGVGKSTLANTLSQLHPSFVIRTSDVRETLRSAISPSSMPELFNSTYRLSENTKELSLETLFERQCHPVLEGVAAIMKRYLYSPYLCIIEGVHILPQLWELVDNPYFDVLLLNQPSPEEHWARISRRAESNVFKPGDRYKNYFNEIRQIGAYIEQQWKEVFRNREHLHCIDHYKEGLQIVTHLMSTVQ